MKKFNITRFKHIKLSSYLLIIICFNLLFTTFSFSKDKYVSNYNTSEKKTSKHIDAVNKNSNNDYPSLPIIKSFPSPATHSYGLEFDGTYLYTIDDISYDKFLIIKLSSDTGSIIDSYEWTISPLPMDMVWDGNNFYVTDNQSQQIYVVDSQFNYIRTLNCRKYSTGIAFDGIYLIQVIGRNLIYIDPQNGSIINEIEFPSISLTDVIWDDEYLWISCYNFELDKAFICKVDRNGHVLKQFNSPGNISLAFDGTYLWFTEMDYSSSTIYKLDIGHSPPPNLKDTDADGVIDSWDKCPETPENSCVNNKGCSCELTLINENGAVEKNKWKTYYENINDNYSNIAVKIMNLTDDVDLYVKKGNKPDFDNYDCRPYKGGKRDEVCDLSNNGNNVWYFSIYGYKTGDFTISVKAKR